MKVIDFIFCDDVRREIGNKITLVGVYNEKLTITPQEKSIEWPLNFNLGVYARFLIEPTDPEFDSFQFTFTHNSEPIVKIKGSIISEINREVPMTIEFKTTFHLKGTGQIHTEALFLKENKAVIKIAPNQSFQIVELTPHKS